MTERFIGNISTIGEWNWEKLSRCIVCNLPIKQDEAVTKCPYCGRYAHRDHLLEWIKIKGKCPFCGRKLNQNQLKL
ncbi:MAG: hypothetical protein EU549_00155 [Promethearchaeota archaeon]|nr:MAG: hypothetical protein EU549_00155 [Candidatus Lokiarchaeota archaeon]